MNKYIIRWQMKDSHSGKYIWNYLAGVAITHQLVAYKPSHICGDAVEIPEEVAEWLCEIINEQDKLNPEMFRIQEGSADEM